MPAYHTPFGIDASGGVAPEETWAEMKDAGAEGNVSDWKRALHVCMLPRKFLATESFSF